MSNDKFSATINIYFHIETYFICVHIMPEYIYCLRETEFVISCKHVYKIGKTKQNNFKRFTQYPCGSEIKMAIEVIDCDAIEKKLIDVCLKKFKLYKGNEYFQTNNYLDIQTTIIDVIKDNNVCDLLPIANLNKIDMTSFTNNEHEIIRLINNDHNLNFESFNMGVYIKTLSVNRFIYKKNDNVFTLYCYNGKIWETDDTLFKQFISTDLHDFLKFLLIELYFDHINFNKMKTQLSKLKQTSFKRDIVESYKEVNTINDIHFDDKWNLFGFTNVVYDLNIGEFREYRYDDYVSTTTGYDWREPTNEEIELLNKLIVQVMPIEAERKMYLQILCTCLDGKCLEKFIIFNGKGGNGKGMINDALLCALGNYGMTGNNSILTETAKTGSNPEKANIHKKRCVIFREPPENKRFENSIIKELTGGGNFSARGHHETNIKKELNLTMIVEANKTPLLAEEPTEGDVRRIIDVYFRAKFTDKTEDIDSTKHVYAANPFYKTTEFKEKYKFALLKILMDAYKSYKNNNFKLDIPDTIVNRTRIYLEKSCNIPAWFKENYECTNNTDDICKIKDLYDFFTCSDFFKNLTRNEKRKYNKSFFDEFITSDDFLSKYHKDRHNTVRNCIVGWKQKE